ncbi:MAG: hypothetical protein V4579_10730 [Pseudomonadota bacterium]
MIRHASTASIWGFALALALALAGTPAESAEPPAEPAVSYADLADLADRAPVVLRAQVRKVAAVEPERAPGLRPGWARIYVEAQTQALLAGPAQTGSALRYLADVPLDAKGKAPRLTRRSVLLFARPVVERPGELQLVAPDAQLAWGPATEQRVRAILGELLAADAAPRVHKVREAIHVPGTLAGEGETQLFLETAGDQPATISVVHKPGEAARWSASFSEVLDTAGTPPPRETLAWYRLACFLPDGLDAGVNVSATAEDRAQAEADYAMVRAELGECPRARG